MIFSLVPNNFWALKLLEFFPRRRRRIFYIFLSCQKPFDSSSIWILFQGKEYSGNHVSMSWRRKVYRFVFSRNNFAQRIVEFFVSTIQVCTPFGGFDWQPQETDTRSRYGQFLEARARGWKGPFKRVRVLRLPEPCWVGGGGCRQLWWTPARPDTCSSLASNWILSLFPLGPVDSL